MGVTSLAPFQRAVDQLGGGCAADLHAKLITAWSEPHRHYHSLQHLEEGLVLIYRWTAPLLKAGSLNETALAGLVLAWWFHDAVYDPRGNQNEEQSAALAEAELQKVGARLSWSVLLARMVQATDHRVQQPAGDLMTDLLLDVDLAILGAPAARFNEYEAQVRKEYAWVEEGAYQEGRSKVMAHFRALAHAEPSLLYRTAAGRTLLAQARANLGVGANHDHVH
jgi:predicted metal-dependent HD superfamily phosphohydrolase